MAEEYERVCLEGGLEPLASVLAAFSSAQLSGEFLCRGSPSSPRLTDSHCPALAAGLIASGVSVAVLSNHSIGDAGVEALFSEGEWPALTSLNLSENDIGVVGAASLARTLPGACPNLQELVLDACPLGEAGGCALATLVESHPGLAILRVVRCDFGMDALIALTNSLSRTASLNVLDISEPLLFSRNEETSGHIARALVGNVSLVRLAMRKHKFATDTTTEWLCDALLDNAVLRELDLGGNALGPPSGVHLQKALAAGANLGVLQLAGCRLGDEGACALATVLGGSGGNGVVCSLRHLDLRKNGIGAAGIVALMAALEHPSCPLQQLLLAGNPGLAPGGPGAEAISATVNSGVVRTAMDLVCNTVDGEAQIAEIVV